MDRKKPAATHRTPRPRRGRDGQATRHGLLTAATQLFAARGFDGVSVEQIAQRAGVTKALINYHFGGKHKLYLTIMTSTFSEIVDRVEHVARRIDQRRTSCGSSWRWSVRWPRDGLTSPP